VNTRVSVSSSELVPPPFGPRGETQSLAGEGVGDPIGATGPKTWHSVYSVLLILRTPWLSVTAQCSAALNNLSSVG
jgi:hypothetical protein